MARKPRVFSDVGVYHIILRGNNKQNLFCDDKDRIFFIKRIKKYTCELNIDVYCYCLMNNHIHILIGKADRNMSLLIQKITNSYVYYFNRKYDRSGHLFQGRFKSEPVMDDEYFKTVFRYILKNSEKAGIESFDLYRWNSYNSLLIENSSDFINNQYVISMFSTKKNLLEYISMKSKDDCMEYENKIIYSDEKVIRIIKDLFKLNSIYEFERLSIEEQYKKCKILKKIGISTNQISRVTGISKKIIKTA